MGYLILAIFIGSLIAFYISFKIAAVTRYPKELLVKDDHVDIVLDIDREEEHTQLYQKSLIPDSAMDLYEEKLEKLIKDKVFQDIELSLEGLAKQIDAPKHHLTQLFNIRKKKTFNQYINGLRIECACELLKQNPTGYSIEEIAYECGFNSKVSFNRNFKNITSITPSEYRRRLSADVSI